METVAHLSVSQACPADFYVGYVEGDLGVEIEKLAGDRLWAAYDEVEGVGAEVLGRFGLGEVGGDFSFLLETTPEGSERRLGEIEGGLVVGAYEDGAIGGDFAFATCGAIDGVVLLILGGGAEVGEEHVEIEEACDAGGAGAVDGEPAAGREIGGGFREDAIWRWGKIAQGREGLVDAPGIADDAEGFFEAGVAFFVVGFFEREESEFFGGAAAAEAGGEAIGREEVGDGDLFGYVDGVMEVEADDGAAEVDLFCARGEV